MMLKYILVSRKIRIFIFAAILSFLAAKIPYYVEMIDDAMRVPIDERIHDSKKRLSINPDSIEERLNLLNLLNVSGKSEEYSSLLINTVREFPNEPRLLLAMGSHLRRSNEPAKAIDFLRKGLISFPSDSSAWEDLGYAYSKISNHKMAVICWANAIKFSHPDDKWRRDQLLQAILDASQANGRKM